MTKTELKYIKVVRDLKKYKVFLKDVKVILVRKEKGQTLSSIFLMPLLSAYIRSWEEIIRADKHLWRLPIASLWSHLTTDAWSDVILDSNHKSSLHLSKILMTCRCWELNP